MPPRPPHRRTAARRTARRAAWRRYRKALPKVLVPLSPEEAFEARENAYAFVRSRLTDAERAVCERAEAAPPPPDGLKPRRVRMFPPEECERVLAWAQTAYARGSGWRPGQCWFDDWLTTQAFAPAAAAEGWLLGMECVAKDLDQACHIHRPTQGPRAGVLRLPHDTVMPVGTGRDHDGLGWILALNADHAGGVFYFPELREALHLPVGHALLYPRSHTPGVTRIDPTDGARFTLESHRPPREISDVILSGWGARPTPRSGRAASSPPPSRQSPDPAPPEGPRPAAPAAPAPPSPAPRIWLPGQA